jgi:hypothetical protein
MRGRLALLAGILLLTFAGFVFFPGHTLLLSDTQIYLPMFEHLRDPGLFNRDIMAIRPHLTYTIYDETARALAWLTQLSFETVLQGEQLLLRALGITGLILIARKLGLTPLAAWCAAAIVSLGATIVGPAVLIFEYEPVPRGFAICLLIFAVGLAAHERDTAAGIAAGLAFLYHPVTALPFWIVAVWLRRWAMLVPGVVAAAILLFFAKLQPGVTESPGFFLTLDPVRESLQRMRASYSFVSTWAARNLYDYACECVVLALALWRMRDRLSGSLRTFLIGLPIAGVLSIPLSWVLLEKLHWALIPQWQPARAILFLTLVAMLAAAIAGLRAALDRRYLEAFLFLAAAYFGAIKHVIVGQPWNWRTLGLFAGLAIFTTVAASLASRTRGITLVAASLIPALAIAGSGLIHNYRQIETPELDAVAAWAKSSTPPDALFLFADSGTGLEPGIFRARALRGLYVDWKSGGQINYFPEFTTEWWKRWTETQKGRWNLISGDFPALAERHIDYVVLHADHAIPGMPEAFRNKPYVVYKATNAHD